VLLCALSPGFPSNAPVPAPVRHHPRQFQIQARKSGLPDVSRHDGAAPGRFKQVRLLPRAAPCPRKAEHWVIIGRQFAMSTNVVTVDEFHNSSRRPGGTCGLRHVRRRVEHRRRKLEKPGFAQAGTHPLTCASWNDAEAYTDGYRPNRHRYAAPSASEWEYAARAGGQAAQPWTADGSVRVPNAKPGR